jgi:hypothetical protein
MQDQDDGSRLSREIATLDREIERLIGLALSGRIGHSRRAGGAQDASRKTTGANAEWHPAPSRCPLAPGGSGVALSPFRAMSLKRHRTDGYRWRESGFLRRGHRFRCHGSRERCAGPLSTLWTAGRCLERLRRGRRLPTLVQCLHAARVRPIGRHRAVAQIAARRWTPPGF